MAESQQLDRILELVERNSADIQKLMTTLLREAVEALAQMPEDMQEQAARVIIEFVTALNTAPYAEGL